MCCTTKPATLSTSSNCTHTQCKINMGTAKIVQRIRKVGKTTNLLGPRFGRKVASSYIVQSLGGQDEMFPHGEICTSTGSYRLKRIIGEHLPPQWQQMIIVHISCRCKHGEHHRRRPKAKCLHSCSFICVCPIARRLCVVWIIQNELHKLGSLINISNRCIWMQANSGKPVKRIRYI